MVRQANGVKKIHAVNPCRFVFLVFIWILLSGFTWLSSGPAAELDPFWKRFDETSVRKVDHSLWQSVLDDYLVQHASGINLIDYEGLQIDADPRLDQYIERLSATDPRELNRAEQMSYWINLYNALTVRLVVQNYPVDSIKELGESLFARGPWDDDIVDVAGRTLTLNDIEHRILRPVFEDHRVHFAVNCASIGCPNLNAEAFTGDRLEQQLLQTAKAYLNHPRGLAFEGDKLLLSSIFQWFSSDFGADEAQTLETLAQYLEPEVAPRLRRFSGETEYRYDWSLNDLR